MCNAQDDTLDKIDSFEEAVLGLNGSVTENRDLIMANHESNERQFAELRQMIAELHHKADATMKHQDVPYEKSTMGFMKED